MARNFGVGSVLVVGGLVAAACGDDGSPTIPPERTMLCEAQLAVAGSIAAAATPDPTQGCQPAGTWTVNVQVSDMGTCSAVPVQATYTIDVSGSAHNETITHDHPSNEDDELEIDGDNDACNGNFELVLPDGSMFDQVTLQPHTGTFCPDQMSTPGSGSDIITCGAGAITSTSITLNGTGVYDLWSQHP